MQKYFYRFTLLVMLLTTYSRSSFSQTSLCNDQFAPYTATSNTATSIDILNPTTIPAPGNYSVQVIYGPTLSALTNNFYSGATITAISSGFRITLNASPNLPLNASTQFRFWVYIGTSYILKLNYGGCEAALPLVLTSFTAAANAPFGYAKLTWVTAQEQNTSHFLIQRSTDGANWSSHGIEPAAGNSSFSLTYNFYTPMPNKNAKYYYRLQMFDIDGASTFSQVKIINGTTNGNPSSFCNYTYMSGNGNICGSPNAYTLHNGPPSVTWSASTGTISTSKGGSVATLTGCFSGSATITAASAGCNTSLTLNSCSGGSISGPDVFCTSGDYFLPSSSGGAAITWSVSPADIVTLSCTNCNVTSLTRITDGQITLSASLANSCSPNPVIVTKNITVGNSNNLTGTYNTNSGTRILYTFNSVPAGSVYAQFTWPGVTNISSTLGSGSSSGIGFYSYGTTFSFTLALNQSANVNITGTGTCGPVSATRSFYAYSSFAMTASPNPASSSINLSISKVSDTTVSLQSVQPLSAATTASNGTKLYLYDFYTNSLIKQWSFPEVESSSYSLNIVGVKSGVYVLKMERSNKTTTTKIIVQ